MADRSRDTGRPTPRATSRSRPIRALAGFTTNGIKTIEIYATDDAGAVGNVVTLTFDLKATRPAAGSPDHAANGTYAGDLAGRYHGPR